MQDFEKLGLFYLGRAYDPATRQVGEDLVLYDSRDLVTHAVCVGMTGSGKTGLCLGLLEEAAIDQIPAIAIDPKGDLANLLLTFPDLRAEDFAPYVDEGEARKAGRTAAEFAADQARLWREGLADWGQDGARIRMLRESAEFRVYTPGSEAGLPLSILESFAAPPEAILSDREALNERVVTTASSLLALLGVDSDPMQGRETILIANILADAWKSGADLDLAALIPRLQEPPFHQVGVIDLESFFPAKDRFALAMRLNNMMASPGFESWTLGEPLDVDAMLHAPDGKPRVSIVSIAHLGEAERMFFVALLLNQVLGWVRAQAGTSSLRALLYMDEIYGYFPPTAMPPSKRPLLTLLKQARASGLGVVLATQNPADLDYKGLSNTGTWFLGRLQAERDKLRVLDGLEGASSAGSASFDRKAMDAMLSGLGKRVFLMHNVHEDRPQVFQSRWALSYLRGPLTRQQLKRLMDPLRPRAADPDLAPTSSVPALGSPAPATPPAAKPEPSPSGRADRRPLLPPDVPQCFLPARGAGSEDGALLYRPAVLGCGEVDFHDAKAGVSVRRPVALLVALAPDSRTVDWRDAARIGLTSEDVEDDPAPDPARFEPVPAAASKSKSYATWTRSFVDALYRGERLELLKSPELKLWSDPSESERDFRIRLQQAGKELRDERLDRLRAKYAPKLSALREKVRRAEQTLDREVEQAQGSGLSSVIRLGSTILDAVMGRKTSKASSIKKAGTTIRSASRTMKESRDVSRARENLEGLREQFDDLDASFQSEAESLLRQMDPLSGPLEAVALKPKKVDIAPRLVALAWAPYRVGPDGSWIPAWA